MISRRRFMQASTLAASPLPFCLTSCGRDEPAQSSSVDHNADISSYAMPLESDRHERTFMQWPNSLDVYDPQQLHAIQNTIAKIANTIVDYEPVVMLAGGVQATIARKALSTTVEIWDVPAQDLWCRDSGPTFVTNETGALAIAHIAFNGWGGKQVHAQDALIAPRIAQRLNLPLIDTGLIGEQGGVEHDGNGLVMAHASSWVNPNRNAGTQEAIGDALLAALGGEQMIWAPGIVGADITDYHIDALARFVGPSHVLIQLPKRVDRSDPWSVSAFETFEILSSIRDGAGQKLKVDVMPEPANIRSLDKDFVASYVNYYVCNGAVIGAQFGDDRADAKAREMLATFYPGRQIISLNVDPLGSAGGGIHCATQQQPKAGA
jgi:agmatine deiminase